jgi:hypothetical protein
VHFCAFGKVLDARHELVRMRSVALCVVTLHGMTLRWHLVKSLLRRTSSAPTRPVTAESSEGEDDEIAVMAHSASDFDALMLNLNTIPSSGAQSCVIKAM